MKEKQIKDDELLYLPSSLDMKNTNRRKHEFDFAYSNHRDKASYTLGYDTINKKAIEFIYSNHKNEIDYTWYYSARQNYKYNLLYSTHRGKFEYYFEYLLKRKLNYIFEYFMYPKYGRYIFIYDITSIIHNEDKIIKLVKEDKRNHIEKSESFSPILSSANGYDIVYENVINGLENIDKTIEQYCNYLQLKASTGTSRNISLFSTDKPLRNEDSIGRDIVQDGTNIESARTPSRDIVQDGNKIEFARSPSRDVGTDTLYDFMVSNVSSSNRDISVKESLSIIDKSNDSKDISYYLKNDVTMRKIVDMMYAEKLSEKYLHHSHLSKATVENDVFTKEDDKYALKYDNDSLVNDYFDNKKSQTESLSDKPLEKDIKTDSLRTENSNNPLTKGVKNSPIYYSKNDEQSLNQIASKDLGVNEYISLDKIGGRNIHKPEDIELNRTDSSEVNLENDISFKRVASKRIDVHKESFAKREASNSGSKDEDKQVDKVDYSLVKKEDDVNHINKPLIKTLQKEFEDRLNLHKRFWFVKTVGKVDYKILPNVDYSYSADINIFVEKPDFEYLFEYDCEYVDINSDSLTIELYDYNYKKYENFKIDAISNGEYKNDNIIVNIETNGNKAKFKIRIKHKDLYYIIVRQPLDVNGYPVLYTATKKFLGDNKHPIPFGSDMGTLEIPVHINIMVDFINILLLMWSKFYYQFTGYTGIHAVYGLVNLVYEWLTLETSDDIYELDDYHRCFRWLRWEAEKVYNLARYDANLSGNAWVETLIYELIEYMEMHHMDIMPVFEPNHLMDEYRNIFDDPSFDIDIVLDKVKGIRKRVIDTNKVVRTQKNK